jgi:hypothetical protein
MINTNLVRSETDRGSVRVGDRIVTDVRNKFGIVTQFALRKGLSNAEGHMFAIEYVECDEHFNPLQPVEKYWTTKRVPVEADIWQ